MQATIEGQRKEHAEYAPVNGQPAMGGVKNLTGVFDKNRPAQCHPIKAGTKSTAGDAIAKHEDDILGTQAPEASYLK